MAPLSPGTRNIESLILTVRGKRVILDADLAGLYGVSTKALLQAASRNSTRFPADFRFKLSGSDIAGLRSQIVTSNAQPAESQYNGALRSQTVTSKRGGRRYLPYAFTEHGALQAANVLRSKRAVAMSVYVIRAFVHMREQIAANEAIFKRIAEIDTKLLQHDEALSILWNHLKPLIAPPPSLPKPRIGFTP
jgi:hypothetical protein